MSLWRRQRANLALCLVAVGLIGVTVWDRGRITTDEAQDRQHQLLAAWRVDDIGRVDIQYQGRHLQLEAEHNDDGLSGWKLRENDQLQDVDEQGVAVYLQTLEYAAQERTVSESDRAKLGLNAPRMTITVHMGKLRYTLRIGGEAPSPAGAAYVEVEDAEGRQRYVIGAALLAELSDGLKELRSKRLVPYLSMELRSIALAGPQTTWTLTRGGWGGRTAASFLLKRPSQADVRASRRALDGWLTQLGSADVDRFAPVPTKAAEGVHRLTLTPLNKDEPSAILELGGDCPGGGSLLVRRTPQPSAGCIDEALARRLLVSADTLVDDYLLGSADGDITELYLDNLAANSAAPDGAAPDGAAPDGAAPDGAAPDGAAPDGSAADVGDVDVARKDKGWHMRKPNEGEVAAEPMANWLGRLIAAQGERLNKADKVDLDALGLASPRARVRVTALPERGVEEADQRIEKLDVGQPRDGFVYLKRHDDGAILKLAEDVAAAFVPRASTLRPTTIVEIPREQVAAMRIDCGKPEQHLIRDARGAWTLLAPADVGVGVDVGLANELADQLRTLTALSWAADRPGALHALDEPWCTLALARSQAGEESWMKVLVGGETRGGYFAQLEGEQAVFVLPRALVGMARGWLLDRGALLVDFSQVTSAELRAGDNTLKLTKQGDRWLVADNPGSQLGIQVGRALEQLLADAVVHVGPVRQQDGLDTPRLHIAIQLQGQPDPVVLRVGTATSFAQRDVALVRRDDVAATFAVSQVRLAPLLDAL